MQASSCQLAAFKPFHGSQQTQRQRSHGHRAVSASSAELKRPQLPKNLNRPVRPDPESEKPQKASEPEAKAPSTEQAATPEEPEQTSNQVTIQFQREQAKAMRQYFKSLAYREEVVKSQVFGWTPKNEITNGRWVMFGFAVGLLTEYATGADFIQQLKLMVSYLGIADIYD